MAFTYELDRLHLSLTCSFLSAGQTLPCPQLEDICPLPLHLFLHLHLCLQGMQSLAVELQDKCSSLAEAEARFSQLEQMMQRIVARGAPLGAAGGLGVMR